MKKGDKVRDTRHKSDQLGEVEQLDPVKVTFNKQPEVSFAFRGQLTYTYEADELQFLEVEASI